MGWTLAEGRAEKLKDDAVPETQVRIRCLIYLDSILCSASWQKSSEVHLNKQSTWTSRLISHPFVPEKTKTAKSM